MDNDSLSKNSSKLNLTRRQAALFQKMILVGNQMSDALSTLDHKKLIPKNMVKLAKRWSVLMVELALLLI